MPPHRLIENANHFLSSQSAGAFDSEPEDFSLIGYVFIAGGLTLMVAVGAATSSCVSNLTSCISNPTVLSSVGYYGVAIPLGQSIVLVGAIFAGAGFVTEHLRPPEVRETEDAFLVESEGQKSLFSCPECDAEVEPTATFLFQLWQPPSEELAFSQAPALWHEMKACQFLTGPLNSIVVSSEDLPCSTSCSFDGHTRILLKHSYDHLNDLHAASCRVHQRSYRSSGSCSFCIPFDSRIILSILFPIF